MSFRRMPFQFTTTDPIERQRELERRFGLPANRNMFVDVPNPLLMGGVPREFNTSSSSPRLQHRVPLFVDGNDQPIHSSVDSTGSNPENKKPNVRVIPIEIEGAESRPVRHRTFSGPVTKTDDSCDRNFIDKNDTAALKRSMEDLSRPSKFTNSAGPRVHNIPIQFEGSTVKNTKSENINKSPKKSSKVSGNTLNKSFKSPGKENKAKEEINKIKPEDHQKIGIETSLKKIESVLEELKTYETEIQEFSGTIKDKKYRYLDEMLTRCMIKLDDVDTMGNENVRITRKNAVKKIQAQIDLLEMKANATNESEPTSVDKSQEQVFNEKSEEQNDVEMVGGIESELLEKENEVVNIDTKGNLEDQLDVKMTENESDAKQTSENQEDVEMGEKLEDQTDIQQIKEVNENQLDLEMVEKSESLPEMKVREETEGQLHAEMVEKSDYKDETVRPEEPGNMHEVEMAEAGESSIAQDVSENCETEEVEMTEKNTNLDNSIESENKPSMKSQDVEMDEVQDILENVQKQVELQENASSDIKENKSDNKAEATLSCKTSEDLQDKQCKIDVKSANTSQVSETSNS